MFACSAPSPSCHVGAQNPGAGFCAPTAFPSKNCHPRLLAPCFALRAPGTSRGGQKITVHRYTIVLECPSPCNPAPWSLTIQLGIGNRTAIRRSPLDEAPFRSALCKIPLWKRAGVAELADAPDSKSGARKGVEVQVLSPVLVCDRGAQDEHPTPFFYLGEVDESARSSASDRCGVIPSLSSSA